MMESRKPTKKIIQKFLSDFNKKNIFEAKSYNTAIDLVSKYPKNNEFESVFIKVNFINSAFKTRIGDTLSVTNNILKIRNLDAKLAQNDLNIIEAIGKYKSKNKKEFNFYSFATKYCHCHYPKKYPIFDKNVKTSLEYYRDNFNDNIIFKSIELRDYRRFKDIVEEFKIFSGAEELDLSMIDRFLWAQSRK